MTDSAQSVSEAAATVREHLVAHRSIHSNPSLIQDAQDLIDAFDLIVERAEHAATLEAALAEVGLPAYAGVEGLIRHHRNNAAFAAGFDLLTLEAQRDAAEARAASLEGGARLIATERQRQISEEGWTFEHDDKHSNGDLAWAAAAYALNHEDKWPWPDWWNPGDDPVRRLTKAGALIAAEIDRLARAALAAGSEGET